MTMPVGSRGVMEMRENADLLTKGAHFCMKRAP